MNPGQDNPLWQRCWRDKSIDFHLKAVNPLLPRFWPRLGLPPGSRILVPLCGKSLDLQWLSQQGYPVVGVELSPIAVRAYFRERHLQARRRQLGEFILWQAGSLEILCGDFFALTPAVLGPVAGVYDRAGLTALPESSRPAYVALLAQFMPAQGGMLLLTTEEVEAGEKEADSAAPAAEIQQLFTRQFELSLAHVERESAADSGSALHKVYCLTRRQPDD